MSKDAMYLRKSRVDLEAERHGAGDTLSRHKQALMAVAKAQGLNITKIYQEVVSGETITARPEMQKLLHDVEAGMWDSVLVYEVERLARGDTLDQGMVARAFRLSGTKIITPNKVYDPKSEFDEEYFEFGLFMSRREYKTINRRQQAGRLASVNEGKFPGNKAPYGYDRKKLEDQKGWTLVPNENAHIVASIFQWYTAGLVSPDGGTRRLGVSQIVRRLNDLGIPAPGGKDWTNPCIINILRNETYAGWVRWGRRKTVKRLEAGVIKVSRPVDKDHTVHRGLHDPIVPQEIFDQAQTLLQANPSRPGPRQFPQKNPLAGLVKCALCGRSMVRRPYNSSGHADSLLCPYTSCPTVSSDLALVEDAILEALERWYKSLVFEMDNGPSVPSSEIQSLRASLTEISAQLDKVAQQTAKAYDFVEQGIYSTDVFLARSQELSARRSALEEREAAVAKELSRYEQFDAERSHLIPQLRHVLDVYRQTDDPVEKSELLKSVLDHVTYSKSVRLRWTNRPGSEMEITLHPRLPHIK